MELDDIRTKTEKELRYRRGRSRNHPKFMKIVEKYRECGEPLHMEDVEKFMGLTHHTLRQYAKDMGLRMTILTDDEGRKWLAFREM